MLHAARQRRAARDIDGNMLEPHEQDLAGNLLDRRQELRSGRDRPARSSVNELRRYQRRERAPIAPPDRRRNVPRTTLDPFRLHDLTCRDYLP
jgi:hypothetical protein